MQVGSAIRDRRRLLGMTQAQVAEEARLIGGVRITDAYISMVEHGKKVPSVKLLVILERVLGDGILEHGLNNQVEQARRRIK